MTKREYIALAAAFKRATEHCAASGNPLMRDAATCGVHASAVLAAKTLLELNPSFDYVLFLTNCGVPRPCKP